MKEVGKAFQLVATWMHKHPILTFLIVDSIIWKSYSIKLAKNKEDDSHAE